jgi:hypothetical protein
VVVPDDGDAVLEALDVAQDLAAALGVHS